MSTIIKGSLQPFLQNESWEYDPKTGVLYTADFKGASQSNMLALANSYYIQGIACRLTNHQGDTASLVIQDPTGTWTIDTWQILGNEELRDIWRHPSVIAIGLTTDQMATIRQALDDHTSDTALFGGSGALNSYSGTIIQRFYRDCLLGSNEYRRGNYVLRHTTNVSNRWTVNIADVGIDCIYTPAQLLTETTNASLWIYPLPPRLQYKISNIPAPAAVSYYQWGWLKSASNEVSAANNRVEISNEYVLDLWSTDRYAPF